ncbi:MAG: hypothetical protein FWG57_08965 [Endomicrobia bacterium]|nr:hypothetical protein [Endomicrobiia bacterium]
MFQKKLYLGTALCLLVSVTAAFAQDSSAEERIQTLEEKVKKLEKVSAPKATSLGLSAFNPAISVVLNGQYGYFSENATNIPGFQIGDEGFRAGKGFSLGETELDFSANVDHTLFGMVTLTAANEDGEDIINLEEAYIKTLALPYGITATAGRFLPVFGYLNAKHRHEDDFADRPLPYRAYLNSGFSDDGIQASVVLPTSIYSEIGGGVFRGRGFPAATVKDDTPGLVTGFARIGGDFGTGHDWLFGISYLHARDNGQGRESDDGLVFTGSNDLYGIDFKYVYSPKGNNKHTEFSLQAEYLFRNEEGEYEDTLTSAVADIDDSTSGFYAQAVYKFMKKYRVGYRYALLNALKTPAGFEGTALDSEGHNPQMHSLMAEYNTSEFGRFRAQYNYDKTHGRADSQVILQYVITFGAHGAHTF